MTNYYKDGCPWCGGEVDVKVDMFEVSLAFSTSRAEYLSCTECSWTENEPDDRSEKFTFTQ